MEYIEREAVMQKFADYVKWSNNSDFAPVPTWNQAVQIVEDFPAANVRPVVRGKWKKRMKEKETPYYKAFTPIWSCSKCGTEYDPSFCMTINFCPNCGADMREET